MLTWEEPRSDVAGNDGPRLTAHSSADHRNPTIYKGILPKKPKLTPCETCRICEPRGRRRCGRRQDRKRGQDIFTGIIDRFIHHEDRKIARASASQDVLANKIKNAEALLKLSEKAGMNPDAQQLLVTEVLKSDYFLEGKLLSRQITRVVYGSLRERMILRLGYLILPTGFLVNYRPLVVIRIIIPSRSTCAEVKIKRVMRLTVNSNSANFATSYRNCNSAINSENSEAVHRPAISILMSLLQNSIGATHFAFIRGCERPRLRRARAGTG